LGLALSVAPEGAEADPQTKAFIDEIHELKEGQTVVDAPSSCGGG
jgi:hypothetical protein